MSNWFRHDSGASNDPKILLMIDELGIESYGIFWILIELLREQPEYSLPVKVLPSISKRYGINTDKIEKIIKNFDLFFIDFDDTFYSIGLKNRMKKMDEKSISAKKSAEKRWNLSTKNANAMRTQCERNANALQENNDRNATAMLLDKIRIDKIKENCIKENSFVKTESFDDHESTGVSITKTDYWQVVEAYHRICADLPTVSKITNARKIAIKARLSEYSMNDIENMLKEVKSSDFLCRGDKWRASFDWLFKQSNFSKVIEGNYRNRDKEVIKSKPIEIKNSGCDRCTTAPGYRHIETKRGLEIRRCECNEIDVHIPVMSENELQYER
jgi:uncharacterized protein YdaU (DUF1376 family)